MRFHRGLVLIGRAIHRVDLHRRVGEGGGEIADGTVSGVAAVDAARVLGVRPSRAEVIAAGLWRIVDTNQRRGGSGLLESVGDHEGHRKSEIAHLIGIERGLCARKTIRQTP